MGTGNSLKMTQIVSLSSNFKVLMAKIGNGKINRFLKAFIHKDNSI